MYKIEKQLNWEGESLFHPWRVGSSRADVKHLDANVSAGIGALAGGRDEEDVLNMLR